MLLKEVEGLPFWTRQDKSIRICYSPRVVVVELKSGKILSGAKSSTGVDFRILFKSRCVIYYLVSVTSQTSLELFPVSNLNRGTILSD